MAKIELKGVIRQVTPVTTVGANNTKKQSVILFIPAYVDEFGDKKGQDEMYELGIIGDAVAKLNLTAAAVNQKAKCTVYISGREFTKEDKTMYFISANLNAIELLGEAKKSTSPAELPAPVDVSSKPEDDDLPF